MELKKDPFAREELTPEEQEQQRVTRDALVDAALFPTDGLVIDHRERLLGATPAARTRFIVEAAIGALLADGHITCVRSATDTWISRATLPTHLQPTLLVDITEV